ncbi:dihydrodipicolinate synthase family protein [Streptosporangiaceae bacterium NEAU-GS5]|nr:dihydrodipicolinate synthase family protein [Streptosporangiaceae bacterium NEAU-GS5]
MKLDGVTPIVNTPFTDDLAIDLPSLERLIRRAVDDGVVGCVVPAVASEVTRLTPAERRFLLEAVVEVADGDIEVIAGVSADDLADSVRLAEHAVAAGCGAVLCRVPEPLLDDPDAVVAHFARLGRVGVRDLVVQDLQWNGPGLPVATIARLYEEVPAVTAIKVETAPAGPKYSAILEATGGGLHVSCGWGMGQMVEALDRGVATFGTTAINLPFVEVHRRHRAGDRAGAVALFAEIAPMVIWCQQHIDVSVAFLKRYCHAVGLFSTARVRPPGPELDAVQRRISDELVDLVVGVEDRLRAAREAGTRS